LPVEPLLHDLVASGRCPYGYVGLAADLRPALVTRTLRSSNRLLARTISAPANRARELLALFLDEIALRSAPTMRY